MVTPGLVGRPLDETSSWWWQPPMSVCKLCWPLRARMAVIDQFFFALCIFYIYDEAAKNKLADFFGFNPH